LAYRLGSRMDGEALNWIEAISEFDEDGAA